MLAIVDTKHGILDVRDTGGASYLHPTVYWSIRTFFELVHRDLELAVPI